MSRVGGGGAGDIDIDSDNGTCDRAGTQMLATLPDVDITEYEQKTNPCLDPTGLLRWVHDFVPVDDEGQETTYFIKRVAGLVARLSLVNDVISCGYRTNRLTVMLYHSRETEWSVGMVVVVRGSNAEALLDTSTCFLIQQVAPTPTEPPGAPTTGMSPTNASPSASLSRPAATGQRLAPCAGVRFRTYEQQKYTIIWIGSSSEICHQMAATPAGSPAATPPPSVSSRPTPPRQPPTPGAGSINKIRGVVLAGELNKHNGPGLSFPPPPDGPPTVQKGSTPLVLCYAYGDPVTNDELSLTSNIWVRIDEHAVRGFVSYSYLDTGGDITRQVRRCTERELTDPLYVEYVVGTVTANEVALRVGPSVGLAAITKLESGTLLDVICYVDAEPVTIDGITNARWFMVYLDKAIQPGFITAIYLRIDGDITGSPCLP